MNMKDYYSFIMEGADKSVEHFLKFQVNDANSYHNGGVKAWRGRGASAPAARSTIGMVVGVGCWVNPCSRYYRDEELYRRLMMAIAYVKRNLRPSGNLDLENCNFDSAPDTAFAIKQIAPYYRALNLFSAADEAVELKEALKSLLKAMVKGVYTGGFHTPNHRWAIASALAICANLFLMPEYMEKAKEYLAEGIDCDESGEYSERSAGGYNAVNNAAMIDLYEETGDENYLEFVRRNLYMMLTYFEDDGTVFTENSTRQDKGNRIFPINYFYQYLYLAHHYEDEVLGRAACRIIADSKRLNLGPPDCLAALMLQGGLLEYEFPGCGFLQSYNRYYETSGIVRHKNGRFSYSLIEDSPKFFFFNTGSTAMFMRLSVGYFEKRHVKIEKIMPLDNGWQFHFHGDGWYYLPYKNAKGNITNFFDDDNKKRELLIANTIDLAVTIINVENGVDITMRTKGIDRVSFMLEICLPAGVPMESENLYTVPRAGDGILMKNGTLTIANGMDVLSIGPMWGDKNIIQGNYGSQARSSDHYTVYNVMTSNFERTLMIRSL